MSKPTIDDKTVPARIYYYLLDWNEQDQRKTILDMFDLTRLCDCTKDQIMTLFDTATKEDKLNNT